MTASQQGLDLRERKRRRNPDNQSAEPEQQRQYRQTYRMCGQHYLSDTGSIPCISLIQHSSSTGGVYGVPKREEGAQQLTQNISNLRVYSCTPPPLTHSRCGRKTQMVVIYNAGESLHLFPFPPPPRASLCIFMFPDEEYRSEEKTPQTDWCNISLPQHGFNLAPQTLLFFSPAPISLSTHLRSVEFNGYHFLSFRLTLSMKSEPWHHQEKLQNTVISHLKTLGLAYNYNT